MAAFSLSELRLLDPLPGDSPAGVDLRWTPEWDRIKEARFRSRQAAVFRGQPDRGHTAPTSFATNPPGLSRSSGALSFGVGVEFLRFAAWDAQAFPVGCPDRLGDMDDLAHMIGSVSE